LALAVGRLRCDPLDAVGQQPIPALLGLHHAVARLARRQGLAVVEQERTQVRQREQRRRRLAAELGGLFIGEGWSLRLPARA
jgi:hypothetical protein